MARKRTTELNGRQTEAISLMVRGRSVEGTAEEIGVSRVTIYNWLKIPSFRDEMKRLMESYRDLLENRINGLAINATAKLGEMMESEDIFIKMSAIRLAVQSAVKLSGKYKELQVSGYVAPPMFLLPQGTRISTVRVEPTPPPDTNAAEFATGPTIDVEARMLPDDTEDEHHE